MFNYLKKYLSNKLVDELHTACCMYVIIDMVNKIKQVIVEIYHQKKKTFIIIKLKYIFKLKLITVNIAVNR